MTVRTIVAALLAGLLSHPQNQTPKTAFVEGVVMSMRTNQSVAGAQVTFTNPAGKSQEAVSTADGKFAINTLLPGRYSVAATKPGFVAPRQAVNPTTIVVGEGQHIQDLQLRLVPSSTLSGRVVDDNGVPQPGVRVVAMRRTYRDGKRGLVGLVNMGAQVDTDDHGEYRLFNLEADSYYLRATPTSRTPLFPTTYYPGVTDTKDAAPINVLEAAEVSGIQLSLRSGDLHSATLKVILDPIDTALASLTPSFYILPLESEGRDFGLLTRFQALGDNRYRSPGLQPGAYRLYAYISPLRSATTVVTITDHDEDLGTVIVGTGVSLSGRIVHKGAPVSLNNSHARIRLHPVDGRPLLTAPSADVADDGSFSIDSVPTGEFQVSVDGLGSQSAYVESIAYGGRAAANERIVVDTNDRNSLEISIETPAGIVEGMVRNDKDDPVEARVVLVPLPAHRQNFNLYKTAAANQSGQFSMTGIPPGDYGIIAWQDVESGAYENAEFLSNFQNRIVPVTVRPGTTSSVSLRLIVSPN